MYVMYTQESDVLYRCFLSDGLMITAFFQLAQDYK